jgi:hypothetical protein
MRRADARDDEAPNIGAPHNRGAAQHARNRHRRVVRELASETPPLRKKASARRIPVQRVGGRVDRAVFLFSEPGDALSAAREMSFAPWPCLSSRISVYFVRRRVEQVRDSPVAPVRIFSAPYSFCRCGGRLAAAILFLSASWVSFPACRASCRARAVLFAPVFHLFVSCAS